MRLGKFVVIAAIAAVPVSVQSASITGDASDSEVGVLANLTGDSGSVGGPASAVGNVATDAIRVGAGGSPASQSISGLFAFDLPTLLPGETFNSAGVAFQVSKNGTVPHNADLYSLGVRASSETLATDGFVGAFGTDPTDAVPLHDDFLIPASNGSVSSSGGVGTGASTLLAVLNALYLSDPNAGDKFLFIRISPDVNPPDGTTNRYRIAQADPALTATASQRPTLTYTTVPEPSSAAPIAACGIGLLARRRRA